MTDSEDEEPSDEERLSSGSKIFSGFIGSGDGSFASLKPDEIESKKFEQSQ